MSTSGFSGPGSGEGDSRFTGSIPDLYEELMVPLIFAEPAEVLAEAVVARDPGNVLETAAGTGVLTRAIRGRSPELPITATDLNQPMIDRAIATSDLEGVAWQQADAVDLPFADASYDVVVCQFGAMFFPDKTQGYAEARRVLRHGGAFLFNVWDRVGTNEIADVITRALVLADPAHPLEFMARTPHGYHDPRKITRDLFRAGMDAQITVHEGVARSTPARAALAFCQGTPLRGEIEKHPTLDLDVATSIATEALQAAWGSARTASPTRWLQVLATPKR
ncbi:MAG: class I SAM-dependent methyltransferase [Marmoricola sp.]